MSIKRQSALVIQYKQMSPAVNEGGLMAVISYREELAIQQDALNSKEPPRRRRREKKKEERTGKKQNNNKKKALVIFCSRLRKAD